MKEAVRGHSDKKKGRLAEQVLIIPQKAARSVSAMQARQYVQQANERARKAYQDLVTELDEVRHPTFAAN
jgi:hypothetical protein